MLNSHGEEIDTLAPGTVVRPVGGCKVMGRAEYMLTLYSLERCGEKLSMKPTRQNTYVPAGSTMLVTASLDVADTGFATWHGYYCFIVSPHATGWAMAINLSNELEVGSEHRSGG